MNLTPQPQQIRELLHYSGLFMYYEARGNAHLFFVQPKDTEESQNYELTPEQSRELLMVFKVPNNIPELNKKGCYFFGMYVPDLTYPAGSYIVLPLKSTAAHVMEIKYPKTYMVRLYDDETYPIASYSAAYFGPEATEAEKRNSELELQVIAAVTKDPSQIATPQVGPIGYDGRHYGYRPDKYQARSMLLDAVIYPEPQAILDLMAQYQEDAKQPVAWIVTQGSLAFSNPFRSMTYLMVSHLLFQKYCNAEYPRFCVEPHIGSKLVAIPPYKLPTLESDPPYKELYAHMPNPLPDLPEPIIPD